MIQSRAIRLSFGLFCLIAAFFAFADPPATAQIALTPPVDTGMQISWEVRNRFRLFREERDFQLQVEALNGRSILASEQLLATQSDGRGWARNTVGRLCIDPSGRVNEPCTRDGVKESYLTPVDHPVTVRLTGAVPVGATCAWSFDDGEPPPRQSTLDCNEPINLRVRYGRPTRVTVDVSSGPDAPQRVSNDIEVRDIFVAGLGDSIASGEGNPDRPVALSDDGFCFRSYLGGAAGMYFRPGRAGFKGARACDTSDGNSLQRWQRAGAQWLNPACHRSLYSYQTRTAMALAVQNPQIAVTYLPLACTGATIADGMFGSQRARECAITRNGLNCAGTVNGQVAELREALTAATQRQPDRRLDLVLLSIGANDINFSGLVADVIIDSGAERALSRRTGVLGSVDDSRTSLRRDLPQGFSKLRKALKPLVGGDLSRVVYVAYADPSLSNGAPCPGGRAGFDVHPSFNANPRRLADVTNFVESEFLPQLKNLALCEGGVLCGDRSRDRMTFVDQHQAAFANHGFCARAQTDPEFDRQCFSATGDSFVADIVTAANNPLACGQAASDFRAYSPRARWIRDANDSYFAAMTYPQAARTPADQPGDIHDATWGVLSAVYGGAIHPTAEGHAAMADAALHATTAVLGLGGAAPSVTSEPIAPIEMPR
ncbi:lysophospholipase L1-like esterase [Nitrobacteraceae bacterium AZCC 1564]